ncbi:hypothetical protein BC008_22960 [Mastigocoleus testarum BC008]|uniref:Uncharacterized protein n=2 Tax=Mastigocoleus TaxID=996924 RepID=A0A0V7ZMD2_9CYAN|nr:hypothetical protein BC008_22960 [Mastigocoleus testarum BC008]
MWDGMELTTNLKSQTAQNPIGEVSIDPNYWFPVAWSNGLKLYGLISVQLWKRIWQKSIIDLQAYFEKQIGKLYTKLHNFNNAFSRKGDELKQGEIRVRHLVNPNCIRRFSGEKVTTGTISFKEDYPYDRSFLEGILSPLLIKLSLGLQEIYSFFLLLLKILLPQCLFQPIQGQFVPLIWSLFCKFLFQFSSKSKFSSKKFFDLDVYLDIEMVEIEQCTYLKNSHRCYVEINLPIIALQRAIV